MSKFEELSKKYQGFLFYPSDIQSDFKINAILLDTYYETKYRVCIGDEKIDVRNISKELSDFLKADGWTIDKIQTKRTYGRKNIFDIPVKIKKIKTKLGVEGILIKVIGNNHESISKRLEKLKDGLSDFGIKPKECIRERPDLEEKNEDKDDEYEEEERIENDKEELK